MSSKSYWDLYYTKKQQIQSFEWLVDSSCLDHLMLQIDNTTTTFVLDIGCGSSLFSRQMTERLAQPGLLVCVDFSNEPLKYLKSISTRLAVDFVQCNCKRLPFRSDLFDLGVDKGYLDSVLKQLTLVSVNTAMNETLESLRVCLEKLDENKLLLQITDEQPELRMSLLDEFKDDLFEINYSFKEINDANESTYFAYFINKTKKTSIQLYTHLCMNLYLFIL